MLYMHIFRAVMGFAMRFGPGPNAPYPAFPKVIPETKSPYLTHAKYNDIFTKVTWSKMSHPLSDKSHFKLLIPAEYEKSTHSKSLKANWNKVLFADAAKDKRSILINKLNSYLSLPDDWDGYDGVAPSKQTVDDAIRLLHLLPNRISIPKAMLGNLGTVGYYWEKENLYAEICFDGDQTFWYYAKDKDIERGEDDVSLNSNTLPVELILFLEQF